MTALTLQSATIFTQERAIQVAPIMSAGGIVLVVPRIVRVTNVVRMVAAEVAGAVGEERVVFRETVLPLRLVILLPQRILS